MRPGRALSSALLRMDLHVFAEFGRAAVATTAVEPACTVLVEEPLLAWPSSPLASALATAVAQVVEATNAHFQEDPTVQAVHTGPHALIAVDVCIY